MAEKVGIVGIGLMGSALSGSLIQAGFEVQGFDTDGRRLDEFTERGGVAVDSPAAAARGVKWMVTSLPNGEIVRDVALGANGIAEGAEKGLILCDASTTHPEDTEKLGAALAERGIRFLDTCVSGTSAMAWEKDLIVIAGGEKDVFDACRPYLESFSRAAYHGTRWVWRFDKAHHQSGSRRKSACDGRRLGTRNKSGDGCDQIARRPSGRRLQLEDHDRQGAENAQGRLHARGKDVH
jgi:6-phosphogluconate dehydrogenase (decarboxylating)